MFFFFRVPVLRYLSICGLRVRSGTGGSAKETLHFLLKIFGKRKQLTTQRSVYFRRNDVSRPNSSIPAQPRSQNEFKSQPRPRVYLFPFPGNEVVQKPDSYDGSPGEFSFFYSAHRKLLFVKNICCCLGVSCPLVFQKPDGEREELGEFLYQYLQRRFGVENMIIEWGYNLHDACARYTHDPRIELFYGILQKEVTPSLRSSSIFYTYECLLF